MKIKIDTEHDELIDAVLAAQTGEDVVLVKDGQSVGRIVPMESSMPLLGPRKAGGACGLFRVLDDLDHELEPVAAHPDREPGSARGFVIIHDSFDDPLDDFRDYV